MQRISVYIPDETKKRINLAAKAKNKAESEIIRDALDKGLQSVYPKSKSITALLELARLAEQIPTETGEPRDVSVNHDYYAWGGEKRK